MSDGPATMTFDSLKQSIRDYVERGTQNPAFVRQLPQIINNAERSLADRLKIQGYRDVLTGRMTADNYVVQKPSGWRNTVTFTVGTTASANAPRRVLRPRSYEYIQMIEPDRSVTGVPQWYTDYNFNNWIVAPTPAAAYHFEAIVYRLPNLLSDSNQQNYLTQYTPNLLLFQCLTNTEPFLKNDPRLIVWQKLLADELGAIDAQEIAKVVDRGQTRTSV